MLKRVYIEITNVCNLQCAFCSPHHREPCFMPPDFFRHCVMEAKPYTEYIYLHVKGEPLIHPQFEEIMSVCDEEGMKVQLVTNGSLLPQHADALLHHPSLRKISFSLQSIEYQKLTPQQLIRPILSFCRQASVREYPYCEIRFWRNDQMTDPRTAECLTFLRENFDFAESGRRRNFRIMDHVYVDFDNAFSWPDESDAELSASGTCHGAVHQIAVLCDGRVVPCCLDQDAAVCFGNLHDSSLSEILSSERYQNMVKGLRRRTLTESFCRRCTFHLRFSK